MLGPGFTTYELLIAVAISAILMTVAAPSLRDFANESRLSSVSSQLASDLNFGRLEAIKRNARVLVCAKDAATNSCSTSNNWQNGWIVCYDADNNDACDPATATDPNPMKVTGTVASNLVVTASARFVRFNPVGTANGSATVRLTGTWSGSTARTATVAGTGYMTVAKN